MNNSQGIIGKEPDPKAPLTQEQVENYIMLQGKRNEPWFKIIFVDESMNDDPTAAALMIAITDMIHAGISSLVLEEKMAQAEVDMEGVNINETH